MNPITLYIMASNKLNILILSLFTLLTTSCSEEDPADSIVKWKSDNETYFINMKDSTEYQKDSVATVCGNIFYYYKITTPGNQSTTSPTLNSKVTVNYKGYLIDGDIFNSTFSNNTAKPVIFNTSQLISGWSANLQQMKIGETRIVVIPQELGYGIRGMQPAVPAYATLKFEIQLLSSGN
jgi:FKBP-type peptidyl-prolyl cis-trans isomerase